jgi:hypothetical protein
MENTKLPESPILLNTYFNLSFVFFDSGRLEGVQADHGRGSRAVPAQFPVDPFWDCRSAPLLNKAWRKRHEIG